MNEKKQVRKKKFVENVPLGGARYRMLGVVSVVLRHNRAPIESPEALLAAFGGPDTTCECGDVKLRAGDAGTVLTASDFPFASAEAVADTILSRAL